MSEQSKKLLTAIDAMRPAMVELQRSLTAIPAIAPESGGSGEAEKAAFLEKEINALGLGPAARYDAPDNRVPGGLRPNLILTLEGTRREETLWIMSHTDVVPAGDLAEWKTDPFVLRESSGKLFGRGTEDNQQGLVASLFALAALKKSSLVPECTVKILFVADEETGSAFGIKHLLTAHKDLFSGPASALVPDAGKPGGEAIEIAEKSILWIKISTKGKQIHGSLPHLGKNAFVAGSDMVLRLYDLNRTYPEQDLLFDPPFSTFSPTKKEANVPNINTIPGDDVFYIDCRILPGIDLAEVYRRMETIAADIEQHYGVTVRMETVQRESSPATGADAPIVRKLSGAIQAVYGVRGIPIGIGGGTVGAFLRRAGMDTVVWSRIESTAHMPNEFCVVDNMVGDAKVMALLMLGKA